MIRCHVLLATGDGAIRDVIATALRCDPFFVLRTCDSAAQAMASAATWRPDLVVLDATATAIDGPAVLAQLHADRRTAPIRVVFLTTTSAPQERLRLKALGAAGVIAKPFDVTELAASLRAFIPVEGALAPVRQKFFVRLAADADRLSTCRNGLSHGRSESALRRIKEIAHALTGAAGIYGFAGITCESAALSDAADNGQARPRDVERAIDRVLHRIKPA